MKNEIKKNITKIFKGLSKIYINRILQKTTINLLARTEKNQTKYQKPSKHLCFNKMSITQRIKIFFIYQKLDVRQFVEVFNVQREFSRTSES